MVKFHSINKVMTVGTVIFFISLVIMAVGALFHTDKTLLAYTFFYGLGLFGISVITILVGVLIGARSGKLQKRAGEIWNNTKKK
jgi:small-conductance mechanosensitive channel